MSLGVEFVFADEDPTALQALLRDEDASDVELVTEKALLPIVGVVVAATVAMTGLTNVLTRMVRLWSCGSIVDGRTATVHVTKNCDLPRGVMIVFTPDGVRHEIREPAEADLSPLVAELVSRSDAGNS
jgi:hypothetical protein